jgi:ribonuclease HI
MNRLESTDVPDELAGEDFPEEGILEIYTDGACSGNPGPCGYGVVMRFGAFYREFAEYLGQGTNNIGELTAIREALAAVKERDLPVRVHTDSSYAIGVLTKGWKAKANRELIAEIKELIADFDDLEFVKVRGHAGIPLNERADTLATDVVELGR